ncbi:MAG TPA: PLP-dependent aminotransferase family protein [Chloroflexota bacterium]|nr:PLP-dependent aminotransferase family protein [Chloroflexota bacterium]
MADALAISLDESRQLSLQQQLYTGLRQDILAGRLRPGERVPATRSLAVQLAISRTTAVLAYEQLLAEGYFEARRGAGTFVSRQLPDDTLRAPDPVPAAAISPRHAWRRLSRWGAHLADVRVGPAGGPALDADEMSTERYRPMPFDFRPGRPDWDAFPHRIWSRLAARRWRQRSADLASYGDPAGYRPLREAIAAHLALSRGVRCSVEQVVVVNGSQQGIDLLFRLWLDRGDMAALEEPGYPGAALALRAHEAAILPVCVDEDGISVESLPPPETEHAPRLVYVTPSHQFPTGATLSLPRRLRLLEWAARRGALVVEDDYDSEFRYSGRPLESLQGLDSNGVAAYVGSFSKALFPPLRVGYVVLPPGLEAPFVAAKWLADRQTATPDQQVLSDFIQEGHFERHLRRMRRLYQSRRDALLAALSEQLCGIVTPGGDGAGLHLIAWLPQGWNDRPIAARAAELGVAVTPLSPYYQGDAGRPGLMLGFAALDESSIREGVCRLAQAVNM